MGFVDAMDCGDTNIFISIPTLLSTFDWKDTIIWCKAVSNEATITKKYTFPSF